MTNNKFVLHFIALIVAAIALTVVLASPALSEQPYLGACAKDDTIDAERIVVVCTQILKESFLNGTRSEYRYLALYHRGLAEERLGKYQQAEYDYREAIKRGVNISAPWIALGQMLEKLGHADATMSALDAMVSASPQCAAVLNNACYARATLNRQLDIALKDCNEALRISPDNYATLDSRCLVKFRTGDYANAIADCDAALNKHHDLPTSLLVRGIAKIRLGYADLGNADIAAATAMDASVANTYAGYGIKP